MRAKGTPKTGGRQKGTPNKVTSSVKEWLTELIDENRDQITKDLKALEPRERLAMLEKFMSYIIPKAKTDIEVKDPFLDLMKLTDEELDARIKELETRR